MLNLFQNVNYFKHLLDLKETAYQTPVQLFLSMVDVKVQTVQPMITPYLSNKV